MPFRSRCVPLRLVGPTIGLTVPLLLDDSEAGFTLEPVRLQATPRDGAAQVVGKLDGEPIEIWDFVVTEQPFILEPVALFVAGGGPEAIAFSGAGFACFVACLADALD